MWRRKAGKSLEWAYGDGGTLSIEEESRRSLQHATAAVRICVLLVACIQLFCMRISPNLTRSALARTIVFGGIDRRLRRLSAGDMLLYSVVYSSRTC